MRGKSNLLYLLIALTIFPKIFAGAANRRGSSYAQGRSNSSRHTRQAVPGQQRVDSHWQQDDNEDVTIPVVEVDTPQCPVGCVCQYARYLDLPISRWIDYMKMPLRELDDRAAAATVTLRQQKRQSVEKHQQQRREKRDQQRLQQQEQQRPLRHRRQPEVAIMAMAEQPKQHHQGTHPNTIKSEESHSRSKRFHSGKNNNYNNNFNEVTYEVDTEEINLQSSRSDGRHVNDDNDNANDESNADDSNDDEAGDEHIQDSEEVVDDNDEEEEDVSEMWRRTNPHFKQATCILQEQTDIGKLVQTLPHDLQSLILLYTDIGRNKTVTISSLKPLNQLNSLEVRGSPDRTMTLLFDDSLDFLFHVNLESITLLRADNHQYPTNVQHPSNKFNYKPRSELVNDLPIETEIVRLKKMYVDNYSLKQLDLSHNRHEKEGNEILPYEKYTEMIKKSRMPAFYGWEHLEVLRIHSCGVNNVYWEMFYGLHRLRHMSLERNEIEKLPPFALYGAMNMRTLSLAHNHIHDLFYTSLAGLLKLRWLDLSDNRLSNLSEASFPPFNQLERIDFRQNPLQYIFPASFWVMNSTQQMHFGSREKALELWNDAPFGSLGELRHLMVENVSIVNLEQNVFKGLKSLEILRLRGSIHSIDFDAFAGVPTIKEVDMDDCGIHRISMDAFIGCKYLAVLKLSRNNLTIIPPGIFDDQPALTEIYLDGNQLLTLPYNFFLQPKLRLARLSDNPWQCNCDMANWRPRITNQEHAPAVERCSSDFQTGRSLGCYMIEDYQIDRRHAPRCTNYGGRSVFYVLRKQLQCGDGRIVAHRSVGDRHHRQRSYQSMSPADRQRERMQQERQELKQRHVQGQQNSLNYALHQQHRNKQTTAQQSNVDISNDI